MKQKHYRLRRALSFVLSFAVILPATVSLVGDSGSAQAATSLNHIEEIKNGGDTFDILEIVPAAGQGSIGYYVDGQEPSANWVDDVANGVYGTTASNRTTRVRTYFNNLITGGALSATADAAPLFQTATYTEAYPWRNTAGYTQKITLATADSVPAASSRGTFTAVTPGTGAFTQTGTLSLSGTLNYVQIIDYFSATAADQTGQKFYYNPTFTQITDNTAYTTNSAIYTYNGSSYVYFGTVGAGDFPGMEIGGTYYYVSSTGAPSATSSATNEYVAVSSSSRIKTAGETGYFSLSSVYTYVGTGGTYNFQYISNGSNNTIKCSTIYYTGGFTNNNWFLRNVFDWETGEYKPTIKVNSVVGNLVTTDMVTNAELIVLSYGFYPDTSADGTQTAYTNTTDISSIVSTAISTAVNAKKPVIVDNRLCASSGRRLQVLAYNLKNSTSTTSFVNNSVFLFVRNTTAPARYNLVTQNFATAYDVSTYDTSSGGFYPAYDEIVYENFIRTQADPSATTLPVEINMARAIRHIINFANPRYRGTKNIVRVLSIEPSSVHTEITASMVQGWGFDGAFSVKYVSSLELVGKIDDLIENYDIIYVGGNDGSSASKDLHLDGNYLYANIGEEVTIRNDVVGLTDAEYSDSTYYSSDGGVTKYYALKDAQKTRYSGNDLSAAKLAELNAFAAAGHPVIYADGLACKYSISAVVTGAASASGTSAVLTASPSITGVNPASAGPYYEWFKKNTYDSNYSSLGQYASTYTATSDGEYYCRIRYTISGADTYAYSNSVVVTITAAQSSIVLSGSDTTGTATYDYNNWWWPYTTNHVTYTYSFATYLNGSSIVTGYNTDNNEGWNPTFALQWYKNDTPVGGVSYLGYSGSSTYTPTDGGTYYCKITLSSISNNGTPYNLVCTPAQTKTATVTYTPASAVIVAGDRVGTPITAPAAADQAFYINGTYVDNCSNMYAFLNGNKDLENVMRAGDIDSATLQRYLNFSTPTINLTSYPTTYRNSSGVITPLAKDTGSDPATYTLRYDFTIANLTDTTPTATGYYCNLYIDYDSDGRYIEQERIGSITIRDALTGTLVTSGSLKTGTEYIVTYTLPSGMVGYIPWKLEVVKSTDSSVHTSYTNNTYVKPVVTPTSTQIETLNILQINTGRVSGQTYGSGGSPYGGIPLDTTTGSVPASIASTAGNSATQIANITASWNTIYNLLRSSEVASDYTINIQTVTTTQINGIGTTGIDNTLIAGTDNETVIKDFLESYDMVIIGFDDAYNELDKNSSTALVNYLKSNHPILYTHDATSMANVPEVYMANKTALNCPVDNSYYYGYYFNSLLRDALGLDRYGVTDDTYGHTIKSNPLLKLADGTTPATQSGIVARGYTGLDTATKQAILDAGYSIAYLPGSNTSGTGGTPIATTQGLTNYTYSGNTIATAVTQINEGQITTYPFDINTSDFGGTGTTMSIRDTHQQYYQIDMNPENVVVWYCLSSSSYEKNDAANAYYIFSNGNATYSGFGHTIESIGTAEAKLFVNSIIAAYRITDTDPVIKFTDITGQNALNSFLVPSDSNEVLQPTPPASDSSRYLYFTIDDSNIAKNKTLTAVVSSTGGTGSELNVPIYNSQTNSPIGSGENLVSGLAYYVKIDEVITALAAIGKTINDTGTPIYLTATVTFRGLTNSTTASVMLRRLELFDLN